ncbi:hypothetical protein ACVIIW_006328 [Bradyrhizobium sp. USDA 4449]
MDWVFAEYRAVGWEWLQRETDIFATFMVEHYRKRTTNQIISGAKKRRTYRDKEENSA